MEQKIYVENLKCSGCASTIKKGLLAIDGLENIEVDVKKSKITFLSEEDKLILAKEKLSGLGYPEAGDKNTVIHKAKSFVSCATGRISK